MELFTREGARFVIDDADAATLKDWTFSLTPDGHVKGYRPASTRSLGVILMDPQDGEVDHVNGDKLDNRRANLRVVSHAGNCQGWQNVRRNNTSGYRGVSWYPRYGKWVAFVTKNGRRRNLGYFATREEAAAAVEVARKA